MTWEPFRPEPATTNRGAPVRKLRPVPRLLALVAVTMILTVSASVQSPVAGVAYAAPAALSASFRDLPSSVRAGNILAIQVTVPSGTTCDGIVTYRDSHQTKLDQRNEGSGRCRWDITVPSDTRRGTADIDVTARRDSDQTSIAASIEVTSRGDDIEATFKNLPSAARRGDSVGIRVDVSDGASCQGNVVYDDGRAQALEAVTERRQRCRWEITVLGDAPYGPAKIRIGVTEGSGQLSLSGSFEVARDGNDTHFDVGLKDLPATIRREDAYVIRALVPQGATCNGTVAYYGASQTLDQQKDSNGECTWSTQVPASAKAGNAEIRVSAQVGNDTETAIAALFVERGSADLGASFKDLPISIKRGQDLEIRVNVPNGATCDGSITFYDANARGLGAQPEHKDRCLWEINVPSNAPRGAATIRVTVTEGGDSTTLVANVEVLGKNEESKVSKATWGDGLPSSAKPGDTFDVRVKAPDSATCTGKIMYADGMKWVLGKRDSDSSECRWTITVPISVGSGKANVEVVIVQGSGETKLNSNFDVSPTSVANKR